MYSVSVLCCRLLQKDAVEKGWVLDSLIQTRQQAQALSALGIVAKHCGQHHCPVLNIKSLLICRGRLGIDDMISVLQRNRLRWYGHVVRKEDNDWVKSVWSIKWRVPGQEVDQRKLGERLC